MKAARRYLLVLAWILLPLSGAAIALNLLADPYAAHPATGLARLEDFRRNSDRATKAERLSRGGFETLVFGTSVANQTCDPADPAFGGARVFVAGLPGANLFETRKAFDFALDHGHPRTAVLFLDVVMLSGSRTTIADFDQSLFNPGLRSVEYDLRQLLGWDPTLDSLQVLADARRAVPGEARTGASGFRRRPPGVNLARADFEQTIRQYLLEEWNGFRYAPDRVDAFRAMLERCRREGVRTVVVIPPFHALALEGVRSMGLWKDWERMERDAVAAVEAATAIPSEAPPPVLWDFTGWSGPRAEEVPTEGRATMIWYSDPIHPTAALGAAFLARAMGRDDLAPPDLRTFGARLSPESLEEHLAALLRERDAWAAAHPAEVARLAALHASTAGERSRRLRLAGAAGDRGGD